MTEKGLENIHAVFPRLQKAYSIFNFIFLNQRASEFDYV